MSRIQSNVGLITGIPIQDTVNQLMEIAAQPRRTLKSRTDALAAEQTAIDQVASLLLGFRFAATRLNSVSIFSATTATSSQPDVLSVATNTTSAPQAGTYTFTPLQTAASHQLVSSSLSDAASQLASGSLRIGVGGHVDRGIRLDELNAGAGVPTGKIRISDRSGAAADIDLRTATTIDDVLTAINASTGVDVTAAIVGDAIQLTDHTGGAGTLRVRDVGIGTTASALGLAGINVASDQATGSDTFTLHAGTRLSTLNDGGGVRLRKEIDDLEITLADATTLLVNLGDAKTLGDVVDAINAADNSKLTAAIAADGNRLELTDLTSGGGTFAVASIGAGTAAEDLGLATTATGSTLTGSRLTSGLRDTLVRSLRGGQGLGALGAISITDRAGSSAVNVDLSPAETLGEIVDLISGSGAEVIAAINSARNGIIVTDTSGGTANLVVANADASNTAEALGIAIDEAVASVDSGSLDRRTISEATQLDALHGGKGVRLGDFRITDSSGAQSAVSLNDFGSEAETVGDVIDAINSLTIGVEARINDRGDGILLVDTAAGSGTLTVAEIGGGNTAADLRLLGASQQTNQNGQQTIDGSASVEIDFSTLDNVTSPQLSSLNNGNGISLGTFLITDSAGQLTTVRLDEPEAFTIDDVIDRINTRAAAAGVGVSAAVNNAGTGVVLTDTAGGSGTLTVADLGSGTSAADLKIAGEAKLVAGVQTIDGKGLFPAQNANQNALEALASRINAFGGEFTASAFFDGNGYRLSVTAASAGAANELLVDTSAAGFSASEVSRPQDAVLGIGNSATGGVVITSQSNTFKGVVGGLDVTIENASDSPVTVEVTADSSKVIDAAEDLVESFNSLRATLAALTEFDEEQLTTGLLFGRGEVLRVETDLARLLSGRFSSGSIFRTLESIGIRLDGKGTLTLDKQALTEAYETNAAELQQFFTTGATGFVAQLHEAIDRLAGDDNSVLALRSDALTATIESNQQRLDTMDRFLERERERTLLEFFRLEEVISKMQANLAILDSMQAVQPLSFVRNNR